MAKIKIKQIYSDNTIPSGSVITTDGFGGNYWTVPVSAGYLGSPTSGSFTISAYSGGPKPAISLTTTTKVADAVDGLNIILGLLTPLPPAQFAGIQLSLMSANTALLASGYTTNGLIGGPAAGTTVASVASGSITTGWTDPRGDASSGSLSLLVNGSPTGENINFTENIGDSKTTGVLRVANDTWGGAYPSGETAPPGFFQTFITQLVNAPALVGLNTYQISHSVSGNSSNLIVVRDNYTVAPTVSSISVSDLTPQIVMSSGISLYGAGSTFTINSTIHNLIGQTYVNGPIITVSGPGPALPFTAGQGGLDNPPVANTSQFFLVNKTFMVYNSLQNSNAQITVSASNPQGTGSKTSSANLLISAGNTQIMDNRISGPVAATRIFLTNATRNTDTPSSLVYTAWNSIQNLAAVGYTHEATVISGTILNDLTDYSTSYMPANNKNYSFRDSNQYVTYVLSVPFRNSLTLAITGHYNGLWVALPGISTDNVACPNSLSGIWWDAMALYNGSGLPGRPGQNAGCAIASGANGIIDITFGSGSSSDSTNNEIFIRFCLGVGQSITALSIS